jgi:hypothetical protein
LNVMHLELLPTSDVTNALSLRARMANSCDLESCAGWELNLETAARAFSEWRATGHRGAWRSGRLRTL